MIKLEEDKQFRIVEYVFNDDKCSKMHIKDVPGLVYQYSLLFNQYD